MIIHMISEEDDRPSLAGWNNNHWLKAGHERGGETHCMYTVRWARISVKLGQVSW